MTDYTKDPRPKTIICRMNAAGQRVQGEAIHWVPDHVPRISETIDVPGYGPGRCVSVDAPSGRVRELQVLIEG